MMADQIAWIRDRNHRRVVTEANGRDSLAMACTADALAHQPHHRAHAHGGVRPIWVRAIDGDEDIDQGEAAAADHATAHLWWLLRSSAGVSVRLPEHYAESRAAAQ